MNPDELRAQLEALAASFMEIRKQKIADGVLTPNPNNSSIFAKAQTDLRSIFDKFVGELLPRIKEATKNTTISFSDADASLLRQTMAQINVYQEALKSASPAEVAAAASLTKSIASFQSNYASYLAIVSKGNPTCAKNLIQLSSLSAWVKGKLETILAGALALPQAQDKLAMLMDVLQTGAATGVVDGVLVYATFKKKLATTTADLQTYQQQFETDKLQFPEGSAALNSDAILQLLDKGLPNRQGGTQAATDAPDVDSTYYLEVSATQHISKIVLFVIVDNNALTVKDFVGLNTPFDLPIKGSEIQEILKKKAKSDVVLLRAVAYGVDNKSIGNISIKGYSIKASPNFRIRVQVVGTSANNTAITNSRNELADTITAWANAAKDTIDRYLTTVGAAFMSICELNVPPQDVPDATDSAFKAFNFALAELIGKNGGEALIDGAAKMMSLGVLAGKNAAPIGFLLSCSFDIWLGKQVDSIQGILIEDGLKAEAAAIAAARKTAVVAVWLTISSNFRRDMDKQISNFGDASRKEANDPNLTNQEIETLIVKFKEFAKNDVITNKLEASTVIRMLANAAKNPANNSQKFRLPPHLVDGIAKAALQVLGEKYPLDFLVVAFATMGVNTNAIEAKTGAFLDKLKEITSSLGKANLSYIDIKDSLHAYLALKDESPIVEIDATKQNISPTFENILFASSIEDKSIKVKYSYPDAKTIGDDKVVQLIVDYLKGKLIVNDLPFARPAAIGKIKFTIQKSYIEYNGEINPLFPCNFSKFKLTKIDWELPKVKIVLPEYTLLGGLRGTYTF